MMAAPARNMECDDSSSSSDDEALRRCQEAVWETRREEKKDEDTHVQQSKRVVVGQHEHDGNQLQVTRGFQTHVAKKLGALLDSRITEEQTETSSSVEPGECDADDDEGFRLFSTSVPGQTADDPPAPVRRRPVPSSSDSDSEMEQRLKEAAVSVKDLLPSLSPTPSAPCSEKVKGKKKLGEEEESHVVKKKKKKRKQNRGGIDSPPQTNGERRSSEQEQVKVKRKKKLKQKTEEEASN